jgi:hypothetical protein
MRSRQRAKPKWAQRSKPERENKRQSGYRIAHGRAPAFSPASKSGTPLRWLCDALCQ